MPFANSQSHLVTHDLLRQFFLTSFNFQIALQNSIPLERRPLPFSTPSPTNIRVTTIKRGDQRTKTDRSERKRTQSLTSAHSERKNGQFNFPPSRVSKTAANRRAPHWTRQRPGRPQTRGPLETTSGGGKHRERSVVVVVVVVALRRPRGWSRTAMEAIARRRGIW